jgi:hypothetical protein
VQSDCPGWIEQGFGVALIEPLWLYAEGAKAAITAISSITKQYFFIVTPSTHTHAIRLPSPVEYMRTGQSCQGEIKLERPDYVRIMSTLPFITEKRSDDG